MADLVTSPAYGILARDRLHSLRNLVGVVVDSTGVFVGVLTGVLVDLTGVLVVLTGVLIDLTGVLVDLSGVLTGVLIGVPEYEGGVLNLVGVLVNITGVPEGKGGVLNLVGVPEGNGGVLGVLVKVTNVLDGDLIVNLSDFVGVTRTIGVRVQLNSVLIFLLSVLIFTGVLVFTGILDDLFTAGPVGMTTAPNGSPP